MLMVAMMARLHSWGGAVEGRWWLQQSGKWLHFRTVMEM